MHITGCQPPYKNGTGGSFCCCRCCPPPCCPCIMVYFQCGSPLSTANPYGCDFDDPCITCPCPPTGFTVPNIMPTLPKFDFKPILSKDRKFTLGNASVPCSVPCETICVEVHCGGFGLPCCCLQLIGGTIIAVGNGYVTAPNTVDVPGCGTANVLLNGSPPPIFVNDGDPIVVTIEFIPQCCCCCEQIDIVCTPCLGSFTTIWKRKVDPRSGKTKINPKTGKPLIVIDRKELTKRILNRIKKSRRK